MLIVLYPYPLIRQMRLPPVGEELVGISTPVRQAAAKPSPVKKMKSNVSHKTKKVAPKRLIGKKKPIAPKRKR